MALARSLKTIPHQRFAPIDLAETTNSIYDEVDRENLIRALKREIEQMRQEAARPNFPYWWRSTPQHPSPWFRRHPC